MLKKVIFCKRKDLYNFLVLIHWLFQLGTGNLNFPEFFKALTLFRIGLFGAAQGWEGGGKKPPPPPPF